MDNGCKLFLNVEATILKVRTRGSSVFVEKKNNNNEMILNHRAVTVLAFIFLRKKM